MVSHPPSCTHSWRGIAVAAVSGEMLDRLSRRDDSLFISRFLLGSPGIIYLNAQKVLDIFRDGHYISLIKTPNERCCSCRTKPLESTAAKAFLGLTSPRFFRTKKQPNNGSLRLGGRTVLSVQTVIQPTFSPARLMRPCPIGAEPAVFGFQSRRRR